MKIINWIIITIILSLSAYANPNWFQEANSDYNGAGGNAFTIYASNYALQSDNVTTYNMCEFSGSLFTPVADDFNLDSENELVISTSTSQISIMGFDCSMNYAITLPEKLKAMPVLTNWDSDEYREITFLTNTSVYSYEFDGTSFVQTMSFNYSSFFTSMNNSDAITCFNIPAPSCVIMKDGLKHVLYLKLPATVAGDVSYNANQLQYAYHRPTDYTGVANSRTDNLGEYYAVVGGQFDGGGGVMYYNLLDETSDNKLSFNSVNYGHVINSIAQQSCSIAKVGGSFRILCSEKVNTALASPKINWFMKDLTGTTITNISAIDGTNNIGSTNWMVGDYLKTGSNLACIMTKTRVAPYQNNSMLYCYNSVGVVQYSQVLNTAVNLSDDIFYGAVMGDFLSGFTTLGIATLEGIYYVNGSSDFVLMTGTGNTYSSSRNGRLITTFSNNIADAGIVYSDPSYGFALSQLSVGSCGDSVCSGLENGLTCPQDCSINSTGSVNGTGSPCVSDADCSYGGCIANQCQLLSFNGNCDNNNDCLSGVCKNNKCTKPTLWVSIDASKTENFGSDTNTNNFLAILIMIIVAVFVGASVGQYSGTVGAYSGLASFFIAGFFFGVVGWLSIFLVFGLFFILLAIIIFLFMMGGSSD